VVLIDGLYQKSVSGGLGEWLISRMQFSGIFPLHPPIAKRISWDMFFGCTVGISNGVYQILTENMNMCHLASKFVPQLLTNEQSLRLPTTWLLFPILTQ
jgi:hypothetical protein